MHQEELGAHRRLVQTRSGKISCIDIGTGRTALFVHGICTNSYLWRNVIAALMPRRRCIAVDLPLHGQTPTTPGQDLSVAGLASVLDEFCDALGLTSIDLVANDTGGAIAQIFAARHPWRLATLTLTNCDTSENMPPEAFKPMVELAVAGTLAPTATALLDDLELARERLFGRAYQRPELVSLETIRAYLEPCFGTPERARQFERMLVSLDANDLKAVEPQLRSLAVPTLVVWGTGDVFFDVSWAYWLQEMIPGVTDVVTIDGASVFFPEERAAELIVQLERHWLTSYGGPDRRG